MTDTTPGQLAYQAYAKATGGLTYDGRPMPAWDDLGDRIRHAWAAAALALGMERTVPKPAYGDAWAELTGYVNQACEDGGTIDPQYLRGYLVELKRRALAPVSEWINRTAAGPGNGVTE
jgi:hypothetical protein